MAEEFDPNKAIAETVNKIVESNAARIWSSGKDVIKSVYTDAKVFVTSHRRYVTEVAKQFYKAKSFLIQQTKTPLYNFYVPLGIRRGDTSYSEASIKNLTLTDHFNVITGSGGSGKSMMMRHLFLDSLRSLDKVPVFVELRELNDSDETLYNAIAATLYSNKFTEDEEFFRRALKAGHFAIFLDGFDEADDRVRIAKEIIELSRNYPDNVITVSSRPDDTFSSWQAFNIWKMLPLSLDKACELVEKIPAHIFDQRIKTKFLSDLRAKLFASHHSFLSNPLLLSIMVLTYRDSADIPQKLSVFYDQAYTTLFQRHDALKGGYKRKRYCDLDIQDFSRVFSAFAVLSFDKRKSSFTEMEALSVLGSAAKIVDVEFNAQSFLDDAIQAVSLLIRDGLVITFAHRSFQEYFTALYIVQAEPPMQKRLIRKYSYKYFQDNVANLLYDLDPVLVERELLIPLIEELGVAIGYHGKLTRSVFKSLLRLTRLEFYYQSRATQSRVADGFSLHPSSVDDVSNPDYGWIARFLDEKCNVAITFLPDRSYRMFEDAAIEELGSKLTDGTNISIDEIIKIPRLVKLLAEGDHVISKKGVAAVVGYKDTLLLKHSQLQNSIEAELLGARARHRRVEPEERVAEGDQY